MFIREDIGDLGEVQVDRLEGFQEFFYKDLSEYDVIVGWRADDSYFRYAQDFLNGVIYRSTLGEAIRLGNLGIQYFIQSKKAFTEINRISEPLEVEEYYRNKYVNRDKLPRNARGGKNMIWIRQGIFLRSALMLYWTIMIYISILNGF